jgi:y4mF family transcriptional regulator
MTVTELGTTIKTQRKKIGMTQAQLSLVSGVGLRFISEVEHGKESCHIGKVLLIIETLGLNVTINER